ncbi:MULTISPECIES: HAD family hydrolase [unclassified Pedobacter]|uniref:HAD family hydrolase n=1 Tax=unclassified Pedobacter TaxID=2628915 RepID=UPI00141D8B70|nr:MULTISPECIES: HAD family phosphatase [unclassified Pedobacter]NII82402.1 beta-phosphoglucomutase family hydrolase [Pedobacter sp. SG908]NMN36428.1 beta-phosphoglucomutase family hydrolase [Pedobacter sp. SG918]
MTNNKPKAFIFDLNGTMIDDMAFHNQAWHNILTKDLGASISFDAVKKQMYGKNQDLLERVFGVGHFSQEQIDQISIEKEHRYQAAYKKHLTLIAGLGNFLEKAKQSGIQMAIGSAAIPFNINFVLDNLNIRSFFKAIVSAEDVVNSKPDPETFSKGAEILGVAASECIVFEDAPKGVEAAQNAGMKCVVLTTMHTNEEFAAYNNIISFIEDYTDPVLQEFF